MRKEITFVVFAGLIMIAMLGAVSAATWTSPSNLETGLSAYYYFNNSAEALYNINNIDNSSGMFGYSDIGAKFFKDGFYNAPGIEGGIIPNNSAIWMNKPNKSLSFWINTTLAGMFWIKSPGYEFYIGGYDTGAIFASMCGIEQSAYKGINTSTYYHVAYVRNDSGATLYLNGTRIMNCTGNAVDYAGNLSIGLGTGNFRISELAFWNISLSESQVQQDYNSGAGVQRTLLQPYVINNITYNPTVNEQTFQVYSANISYAGGLNINATFYWNGQAYTPTITTYSSGANSTSIINNSFTLPSGSGSRLFYWTITLNDGYGFTTNSTPVLSQEVGSLQWAICNSSLNITFLNVTYKDEVTTLNINSTLDSSWYYSIPGTTTNYSTLIANTYELNSSLFCSNAGSQIVRINNGVYRYGALGYNTKTWTLVNIDYTNITTNKVLWLIKQVDSGPVTFNVISSGNSVPQSDVHVVATRVIGSNTEIVDDTYTDAAGNVVFYMSPLYSYTVTFSKIGCGAFTTTVTPSTSTYYITLACTASSNVTAYQSQVEGVTYQRGPKDGINLPGTYKFDYSITSSKYQMNEVKFEILDSSTGAILVSNDSLTLAGTNCNWTSCYLSATYSVGSGDNIKGRYYVALNNISNGSLLTLEGDAYWRFIFINSNNSALAFSRFMDNLKDVFNAWGTNNANCIVHTDSATCAADTSCKWVSYPDWNKITGASITSYMCVLKDDYNKAEFSRIVFIFGIFVIFLFVLGKTTGYEMTNPGSFVTVMIIVIWAMSAYGWFTFAGLTSFGWFNQYIYACICSCYGFGFILSTWRRYSQ